MLTTTVVALTPAPQSLVWVDDSNEFRPDSAWPWEACHEHEKRLRKVVKRYDQHREPRWKREKRLREVVKRYDQHREPRWKREKQLCKALR